jgi:3-phenylpropionate/cinnamic acid dioxygenase small subunit
MDALSRLTARADIQDLMARYCRAVDRRDWAALRNCYHNGAHDDHGAYSGDVEGFIAWVSARHAAIPFSMHFAGNALIEMLDEATAVAETPFVVFRRAPASEGEADAEVFGRYLDRIEKCDGAWRYAHRKVVLDETRSRASQSAGAASAGRRDLSDPVFAWLREAGLK